MIKVDKIQIALIWSEKCILGLEERKKSLTFVITVHRHFTERGSLSFTEESTPERNLTVVLYAIRHFRPPETCKITWDRIQERDRLNAHIVPNVSLIGAAWKHIWNVMKNPTVCSALKLSLHGKAWNFIWKVTPERWSPTAAHNVQRRSQSLATYKSMWKSIR